MARTTRSDAVARRADMTQEIDSASPRRRRPVVLISTVVATMLAGLVAMTTSAASAEAAVASRVLVSDSFSRSVSAGLGSAPVGGQYSTFYRGANPYRVTPASHATVRVGQAQATATLRSVRARDVLVDSVIAIVTRPAGRYAVSSAAMGRFQPDGDNYRAVAVVDQAGHLSIAVERTSRGVRTVLARVALRARVSIGRSLHVNLSVAGTSPVRAAARVWISGASVPGWQASVADSSSQRIMDAGSVGVAQQLTAGRRTVVERVIALTARTTDGSPAAVARSTPIAPAGGSPTAPSTPAPSTPAPSTPAPSTPAPSTPAPSTPAPSTPAPSTPAPSTPAPSTPAPSTPSTSAPPTATPAPIPPVTQPSSSSAGSLPVGSASYPVPDNAIFVSSSTGSDSAPGTFSSPKRTLAGAMKSATSAQTIVLRAGTYHESVSVPAAASGVTVENYPGEAVWFDGSVPVTSWQQDGSTWVSGGWSAQFDHSASFTKGSDKGGFVNANYPMAAYPDMMFVDGVALRQVGSPAAVGAGTFYVDYAARTLRIGTDPSGHAVSASDLSSAVTVSATNFTVRGIGIRRYANSLPTGGAIYFARAGDSIENVVVSDVATQGVSMYKSNLLINHVTVERAGMLGITGFLTDGAVVQNSLVENTNTEHFNQEPSAAGMKIVQSKNVTVRNNLVQDTNNSHGIWFDISSKYLTIVGNTVIGCGNAPSIEVELSAFIIVANNTVSGGSEGIYVFDSSDVKIYNNTLSGNTTGSVFLLQDSRRAASAGYADPDCPWVINRVEVYNNDFGWNGGPYGIQFYALDGQTNIPASSMGITLMGNRFHARGSSVSDSMVAWGGSDNKTTTRYETPAALDAGLGMNWRNSQISGSTTFSGVASGEPLPTDVAAAVGQPTGTRWIGAFPQ